MAWYPNRKSRQLIIVEDQLSAIRASEYMNAVALLGTNLNEERAYSIMQHKFSQVFIALDKDARATQTSHVLKYRSMLGLCPLILNKDIKNMNKEEAEEFFSETL